VRKNSQVTLIPIDLRKIILFIFQFSAFLHRLGHSRPGRASSMSSHFRFAPKATLSHREAARR